MVKSTPEFTFTLQGGDRVMVTHVDFKYNELRREFEVSFFNKKKRVRFVILPFEPQKGSYLAKKSHPEEYEDE